MNAPRPSSHRPPVERTVDALWTPWRGAGLEHLRLHVDSDGLRADGVVLGAWSGRPGRLYYRVETDARGVSRLLEATLVTDAETRVRLESDGRGRWSDSHRGALAELDGCLDLDVSATPFTNTLAIRRLCLDVGQSADVAAAYLAVPSLEIRAAAQRYTRLSERRYRYEGLFRGFTADLEIDENGLVLDYPATFRRASPR